MERVVRIDAETHRTIEQFIERPNETGGTLKFNWDNTSFVMDKEIPGKFAKVQIPKGIVQYHTHTSTCKDGVCTLGIPSEQDLIEFTRAFMRGDALIHCLYSNDGCYCISITPKMAKFLATRKSLKEWRARTLTNMTNFHATLMNNRSNYDEFIDDWVALAQVHGIAVHRYNRGVVPAFNLVFARARFTA